MLSVYQDRRKEQTTHKLENTFTIIKENVTFRLNSFWEEHFLLRSLSQEIESVNSNPQRPVNSNPSRPVSWCCRKHRPYFCRGVRHPPPTSVLDMVFMTQIEQSGSKQMTGVKL